MKKKKNILQHQPSSLLHYTLQSGCPPQPPQRRLIKCTISDFECAECGARGHAKAKARGEGRPARPDESRGGGGARRNYGRARDTERQISRNLELMSGFATINLCRARKSGFQYAR
ncbi:hypothetical protein EVAR_8373_1 [Eumeta japonica]|uniref:Uncharacterized protein n=1 Tax=Eumeta variegata TaxID=151549 RepID=A0A4C1VBL2_EUMVA|nr:hypothetical protein EVAR_8373_1 [Eumeta japonica]